MTEQEAKIKDLELRTDKIEDRLKRLEDRMFDTWIAQYDNCVKDLNPAVLYPDVSTKPFDPNEVPAPVPTQACSNEDIVRANKKWSEFISKHPEYR